MKLTKEIKQELSKNGAKLINYPELQNNKEAVLIAVKQNGLVLQFASAELRDDEVVIEEAVKQDNEAWIFASKRLQKLLFLTNKTIYIYMITKTNSVS